MKRGNKLAKAAIEFESIDGILAGFHLVGFTICEDEKKELFVFFPASISKTLDDKRNQTFFFLRPENPEQLSVLESLILDKYEDVISSFSKPKLSEVKS